MPYTIYDSIKDEIDFLKTLRQAAENYNLVQNLVDITPD